MLYFGTQVDHQDRKGSSTCYLHCLNREKGEIAKSTIINETSPDAGIIQIELHGNNIFVLDSTKRLVKYRIQNEMV